MVSVRLILGRQCGFQAVRAAEQICDRIGTGFGVQLSRMGADHGLRNMVEAVRSLRRTSGAQVVHAFGLDAATAACLAASSPVLLTPTGPMTSANAGWLRAVQAYRPLHILASTATQQRFLRQTGVDPASVHLIRPGVDLSRIRRRRDERLREKLGFAGNHLVIGLPGESTPEAGHDLGLWAAAIGQVADRACQALLWGRGSQTPRLRQLAAGIGPRKFVAFATDVLGESCQPEDLLPATDIVVVTAKGDAPTLPIAIAMAAGLPIVSTVSHTVAELLEDRHNCVMVTRPEAKSLARRLLELREDTALQWRISDMAKTEAYEYFSLSRFLRQHRELYLQVAQGRAVSVPEEPPGAGLRFHGRA